MPARSSKRSAPQPQSSRSLRHGRHSAPRKISIPHDDGETAEGNAEDASEDSASTRDRLGGDGARVPAEQDMPLSPQTPTTKSARQFAGLAIDEQVSAGSAKPSAIDEDAVEQQYADLVARGWRPEEELASVDDDDDYEGIDSISQSDDDEKAIRRYEADSLITRQDARRLSLQSEDQDTEWHGFEDPLTPRIDPVTGNILGISEHEPASFLLSDLKSTDQTEHERKRASSNNQKLVRFDVDSSASSADSDSDDEYNDLYLFSQVSQPEVRSLNTFDDVTNEDAGSDAGSEWDFNGVDVLDEGIDDSDDDSNEGSGSSSGYDSDDDELTDEEDLIPIPTSMTTSMTSTEDSPLQTQTLGQSAESLMSVQRTPATRAKQKKGDADMAGKPKVPKLGVFEADPRRPMLVVSGTGSAQRNQLVAAKIQTPDEKLFWRKMKTSLVALSASSRISVQLDPADEMDMAEDGSLFGPGSPFPSLRNTSIDQEYIGPLQAFQPFTSIDAAGQQITDTPMFNATDEDEHDATEMSPFVDWDQLDEDDGDDSQDTSDVVDFSPRKRANTMPVPATPSSVGTAPTPSLSRRGTMSSDQGDELLSHLKRDSGLVNAFRMNQHYVKHYTSYAAHPTTRASTLEANAMQSGRRKWGNTPITPLRKRRGGSLGKIGKLDWSKGLIGDTPATLKSTSGQFKRPMSAGNGMVKRGAGASRHGFAR